MKAILEFKLPEEAEEFNLAVKGDKWYLTCFELDQELRKIIKYDENLTEEYQNAYQAVRDMLRDIMDDNQVKFDM